jgi:hypothetical protein
MLLCDVSSTVVVAREPPACKSATKVALASRHLEVHLPTAVSHADFHSFIRLPIRLFIRRAAISPVAGPSLL